MKVIFSASCPSSSKPHPLLTHLGVGKPPIPSWYLPPSLSLSVSIYLYFSISLFLPLSVVRVLCFFLVSSVYGRPLGDGKDEATQQLNAILPHLLLSDFLSSSWIGVFVTAADRIAWLNHVNLRLLSMDSKSTDLLDSIAYFTVNDVILIREEQRLMVASHLFGSYSSL